MGNDGYRLGLLLVVFGGFLATSSAGSFAGIGVWIMFAGLFVGVLGLAWPEAADAG